MVVSLVQEGSPMRRSARRPQHTFQLRTRPFQIQPFLIAPVLPGETMKSLLMQSRVVTDPIKNALVGWWAEYYFFYVKLRDLDGRDDFTEMFVNQDKDLSAYHSGPNRQYYHAGRINWTALALKRITEEYFRDENEAWDAQLIDGLPAAKLSAPGFLDSSMTEPEHDVYGDQDVDSNADGTISAREVEYALREWQYARMSNLTQMSYEDFLSTYGIRAPEAEEPHRPELIRFLREWSYPVNTVEPTTGDPSSAVSWALTERADKGRFFKEPGFIVGVHVTRPKLYFGNLRGSPTSWMTHPFFWMPAVLLNDPASSWINFGTNQGVVEPTTAPDPVVPAMRADFRDLFMHGDQYANFDLNAAGDASAIPMPSQVDLGKKYPTYSMITSLFVDETLDGKNLVRQDGIVNLSILSHQKDQSPHT